MSRKVKTLVTVTLWGKDVEPGNVIEVNDESAAALVREGAAEYEVIEADQDGDGVDQEALEAEAAAKAALEAEAAAADEIAKQRKALDAQYKKDELAEAAKAAGVEFAYDATKAVIIEAVLTAGKAAVLLK